MMTARAEGSASASCETGISAESIGLRCITDIGRAEQVWRALEKTATMSGYQRYDFLEPWHRHVGVREGVEPLVVVGEIGGRPAFLWPFGISQEGPWRIARWLGGKHVNYNVGLYADGVMAGLGAETVTALLQRVAGLAGRIDAFELLNQPQDWDGAAHPLASLPHQPSPSSAFALSLAGRDYETMLLEKRSKRARGKLRRRDRKLAEEPGYRNAIATTGAEMARVLDAFADQKAKRFAALGIKNPFAEPGVMDFFHELGARSAGAENPIFRIGYTEIGGIVRGMLGGVVGPGRLSGDIISFSEDEYVKMSLGEVAMLKAIEDCCERGYRWFDLGIGEAGYKAIWCDTEDALFDCFVPITSAGRLYTEIKGLRQRVKRSIKQNRVAWALVQKVRRSRGTAEKSETAASESDDD